MCTPATLLMETSETQQGGLPGASELSTFVYTAKKTVGDPVTDRVEGGRGLAPEVVL